MVYLISYDLKFPGRDYTNLIREIKSLGSSWAKPLESVWLVDSTLSSGDIVSRLTALDLTDKVLVIQVTANWAAMHLNQEVVNWMKVRL